MPKDGDLENKKTEELSTEIVIVDEKSIRDKIYTVRGVQVMLDFELAELYGMKPRISIAKSRIMLKSLKAMILCFN